MNSADHAQGLSLSRLVELVHPESDWIVLDVSTGGGHTALTLAPLVSQVVATDLSSEMLGAAEKHIRSRGANNVIFQLADAENLGFQTGEFDLVTNRIALHHFGDARLAI
ncbi:MAG: class I SAM-dependent methyltransferase, partial [Rudaea sp.]